MKLSSISVLVFLFLVIDKSQAQDPVARLTEFNKSRPITKVYLHLDRENYSAGEIIWYNSYLYSDFLPDTASTSVFVELLGSSSTALVRKVTPVISGSSNGQLEIPDSLITGYYTIRAFTATMLDQPDYLFSKKIFIYGKKKAASPVSALSQRLEFFPEGGNFVAGLTNPVAFKLTGSDGFPIKGKGVIRNNANKTVADFSTYHDGMGMFELPVVAGETYYAEVDGSEKQFPLPVPSQKGVVFSLMNHPQGSYFDIQQNADAAMQPAFMVGQMQNQPLFRQDLTGAMQGVIDTRKLRSGILQVTLFSKTGMPLAERMCFVNNREYVQEASLLTDTLSFATKAKNRFRLSFKDSVDGSFSISVYDPEYSLSNAREENILTSLLLTGDIKGYVHNPAYYFSANTDSVVTALDLVMMTNGWRRFQWKDIMTAAVKPSKSRDGSYITIKGKATLRDSKKPFADKSLLLVLFHADSTRNSQVVATDKDGNFSLPPMVFYGKTKLLFSDTRGKKSQYIDVHLSADSLNRFYEVPEAIGYSMPVVTAAVNEKKLQESYDLINKESGLLLETVVLKTRKKTPAQEVEEKYTSGMFAGASTRTIDLINTDTEINHANIFEYLQLVVPGLVVTIDSELKYEVKYRQMEGSVSSMGTLPMTLYLNEVETATDVISFIPANQIALVKVYSFFPGATGNGGGGVLSIYTKKDGDINYNSRADMITYSGYSIIKEFYAPDYTVNIAARSNADNRITLDWRPLVFVKGVNPSIPFSFYNNDRTKSFRVVIEGMTSEGKLLLLEKTITPKGF